MQVDEKDESRKVTQPVERVDLRVVSVDRCLRGLRQCLLHSVTKSGRVRSKKPDNEAWS